MLWAFEICNCTFLFQISSFYAVTSISISIILLDGIKTTWRYLRLTTIFRRRARCWLAIQSWGVGSVYTWHRVRLVGWRNWWMGEGGGIISSLIVWLIESCCTNKRGFIPCIHVSLRYWGRNQNVYAPKATTNNTHTHVSKPTFLPTQKVDIIISTVWVCNGELLFGQISMQQYISSVINPFLFKSTFRWSKGLYICTCLEWGEGT